MPAIEGTLTRTSNGVRGNRRGEDCGRGDSSTGIVLAMEAPAGWREENGALVREFEFGSFAEAIAFVTRVAAVAEAENHHPDLDIRYRRVRVRWTTHSAAAAVTELDHALSARTSELADPA
jgi:4a-hydroxytetrahydrobiopterin dehydratase